MRKIFFLFILASISYIANSQPYTFSNTTDYSIPDDDPYVNDGFIHGAESKITVSGIPPTSEIDYVTVNINHPWDSDLTLYLVYYDQRIDLSSGNGSSGDNYTNTKFQNSAATLITSGSAPFTGTFRPEVLLPVFGDPDYVFNPNGEWTLNVCDGSNIDVGTILDWTIVFKQPTCPTVDYTDQVAFTMACDATDDLLEATDLATSHGTPYPCLYFEFHTDATGVATNNTVAIYEDGASLYSGTVNNNERLTVYTTGPFMSPSSTYTVDVANPDGTTNWLIFDGNGTIHSQGTVTNSSQTNLGACSPLGSGIWSGTGLSATYDYGYAVFDPALVGAGTYPITYTWNNQGAGSFACSGSATHNVTVTNSYSAAWTAPAAMCQNAASVNLTSSVTGTPGGSWSGTGISGTTFNPATAGSGTHTITYTYDNGGPCQIAESHTITVNPLPTVNAGTDQTVCSGTSVTLSGSGASSYTWNNGVTNGTAFTPAVGSVTYTVTGTDANACTNTDQVVVTVNPLPTVYAGNAQTIPNGTATTINDATVNGSSSPTGFNYSWSPAGDLANSTIIHPTTNNLSTTTVFTFTATDQSTGCSASDDVTINISGLSVSASSDQTICSGTSFNITSNGSGGSGTYTYSWISNPTGFTASTQNITVSPTITTTYTVSVFDGSNTVTEDVVVTVNPQPTVNAGADQTVCSGTSVTLSGSGASSYSWDNGVTNGTAFTPVVGSVTYTVIGTDANGCTNTDNVLVTVISGNLSLVLEAQDESCIQMQDGIITATITGGTEPFTYNWSNGSNINYITGLSEGMYSLTVTDFNGCIANDEAGINKAEYECYFIPTIFSPNADKNNDIFHVMAHGVKTFTMFIYDRWGNEIFATTDINDGWNGTYKGMNMNDGAYAYYIKLEYNNGSVKEIKGNITLIR